MRQLCNGLTFLTHFYAFVLVIMLKERKRVFGTITIIIACFIDFKKMTFDELNIIEVFQEFKLKFLKNMQSSLNKKKYI